MGRGQIKGAEIGTAPGEVGDQLRHAHLAEQLSIRRIHPYAAGRGDPDVSVLVAFHAVRHAGLELGANAAGKHPRVGEIAIGLDIEDPDQRLRGVVDIEPPFVRRKAQAVRLVEQVAIDHELWLTAGPRQPIDTLEAELARPLDAIDRHATVPRIGKIDRAGGMYADIVGAVELLPLEMRSQHLTPAVRTLANEG